MLVGRIRPKMASYSKLMTTCADAILHRRLNNALNLIRQCHAPVLAIRGGHLIYKRSWDHIHFHIFNVVVFIGLPLFLLNLFYGRCELREIPEDYEPRFWEYENQPIKQLKMKYGYGSMQRRHEKAMAFGQQSMRNYLWRVKEERIHHLMFERQDYKAWYYIPYQSKWNNLSSQMAQKTIFNRDPIHTVRQSGEA